MLKKLLSVCAGLLFTLTVYAATVEWAENHPDRYTVKKGDTLWDISARFLKKPWAWPEIWQDNPQVKNPHLIYPGDELVLSGNHVGHGSGSIGPHARSTELGAAIPPIPLSALKQWLKNTRIVSEEEYKNAPHVVGIEENQLRGTAGQLVYVRGLSAQPGQKLALVRPMGRYYDMPPTDDNAPREVYRQGTSGGPYDKPDARDGRPAMLWRHGPNEFTLHGSVRFRGYEMLDFGVAEVTRSADVSSALVTYSDFEVRPGDYVLPIDDKPYDDQYVPHSPAKAPDNMRVIAFSDALNAIGPRQVVALSRGAEDGVDNGTTFSIYHPGEEVVDRTDYTEGSVRKFFHPRDARVTLPPEFIGHVMVFRTFQRVSYGLVMDEVKPVHLGDFLHDPNKTP
ncbi:LysM domain-containing protein [Dokdonella soli]|uniref:LysM peptidoglycan-binding domain-containing protein n=1 Tax=Dokdonella soli TaxID=529810 RepID=A0ABN1IGT5_9GAMM